MREIADENGGREGRKEDRITAILNHAVLCLGRAQRKGRCTHGNGEGGRERGR